MNTIEMLKTLLENYSNAVIELESALIFDRQGLLIAKKSKASLKGLFDKDKDEKEDPEIYGAITGIVEKVLKRISTEYEIGAFGTGTFETANHRLVFTEAGPNAILLSVFKYDAELNLVLPYCFLVSEKVSSILDGRFVSDVHSLSVPNLELGYDFGIDPSDLSKSFLSPSGEARSSEYTFKLIVLGDEAVGKTSLINQFVMHKFYNDYKPTLGINITNQKYYLQGFEEEGITITLMIWDLAGQKFFQRVRRHYYQMANAGFIVYDVTNRESFNNIRKWYDDVRAILPNLPIVILGNKIDLKDKRCVETEEAKALARELKCSYLETSAKTGENVKDAFGLIGIGLFFKLKK